MMKIKWVAMMYLGLVFGAHSWTYAQNIGFDVNFGDQLRGIQEMISSQVQRLQKKSKEVLYTESQEYKGACIQAYSLAQLKARGWAIFTHVFPVPVLSGHWAVVMDIDETVLSNKQFQIELGDNPYTTAAWKAWVKRRQATAIPGAAEFIDTIRSFGPKAHIVFVSDREDDEKVDTIANLEKVGLYKEGDIILTKKIGDKTDTKQVRRDCITKAEDPRCKNLGFGPMPILLLVGDSFRDFEQVHGRAEVEAAGQRIADQKLWGSKYIVVPNAMYGQWQKDYK